MIINKRARLVRRYRKTNRDATRAGFDPKELFHESIEPAPPPPSAVPPKYAEQFKKFVADNEGRRKTKYSWFRVVAYGLGLNPDESLSDADRERMTEEEFKMPDPDGGRTARRLFHESTAWFLPKK
jgi:hypothetical protein